MGPAPRDRLGSACVALRSDRYRRRPCGARVQRRGGRARKGAVRSGREGGGAGDLSLAQGHPRAWARGRALSTPLPRPVHRSLDLEGSARHRRTPCPPPSWKGADGGYGVRRHQTDPGGPVPFSGGAVSGEGGGGSSTGPHRGRASRFVPTAPPGAASHQAAAVAPGGVRTPSRWKPRRGGGGWGKRASASVPRTMRRRVLDRSLAELGEAAQGPPRRRRTP